ncbi:uncharacterized protein RJT21DRAFT_102049 [Scheffersomyces amazonensis]|uniref:uncharacterized protein n=1 Tax=Scheffersomyces amazonensis TaxID=1078765 RepID=UPI00315D694D
MDDNSHLKNTTIHTFSVENDLLPRIDETELYKILKGEHKNAFDKCVIVDCRFDYEFEGGHIDGALNISTKEEIEKAFINNIKSTNDNLKTLYVFHCEFSIFRGPTIASHLRKCDRRFNRDVYPYLSYPDIVILEGGYKKFYNTYRDLCFPQGYIEMRDVNHEKHCENRMEQVRLDSKLTRAKSFNQYDNFFESPDNYSSTPNLPLPFTHHRSQSYTTITSEKILKRQRSNSKVKTLSSSSIRLSRASTFSYDQTIFNSNPSSSPLPFHLNNGSSGSGSGSSNNIQDGESLFLPPSTSFSKSSNSSSHRKSYSSCASLNSSSSSVNFSDSNNGLFSSTESLSDSSPMLEFPEYFDSKGTLIRHNSLNICKPLNKKPSGPVPALPNRVMSNSMTIANNNHPNSNFKFPNTIKSKPSRLSLNNRHQGNSTPVGISSNIGTPANVSNKFTNNPFLVASPLISSPLSNTTPLSTLGSTLSTHGQSSSIIDPINDTPVDFSVPIPSKINSITSRYINHSRRTSGSLLSSAGGGLYNFIDIDEAEEEDDEEDDEEEEDEEEDDDVTYYDSTNNTKVTTPGNTINIEKVEPTIFGVKSPFDS